MKKLIYALFLVFCLQSVVHGQIINGQDTMYGNEWIDFDKSYYKLSLSEDGIYRLATSDLEQAGFPVNSVSGAQLQLYLFGEETQIYTSTNGLFGPDDYVEFYGRKNRAELDQHLFENGYDDMLNGEYSLFSDTTAYFLTWDNNPSSERYINTDNDLIGLPPAESYYIASDLLVFNSFHFKPTYNGSDQIRYSSFDYSEGFGSPLVKTNNFTFNPTNVVTDGPDPRLDFRMGTNTVAHIIEFKINNVIQKTFDFSGYRVDNYSEEFDHALLTTTTSFQLNGTTTTSDRNTVSHANLLYPRAFVANPETGSFSFKIEADLFKKYIEVESFNSDGTTPIVYDISNQLRIEAFYDTNDGKVKFTLPPSDEDRLIVLVNETGLNSVHSIKSTSFRDFGAEADINYFIVSNKNLFDDGNGKNLVQEYADYRASIEGGSFNTSIAEIQQLYDQFAFGINRHALSMRNFAQYLNKNLNVEYIFVIGKGREYSKTRTKDELEAPGKEFQVPTYGVPGSDNLISSRKGEAHPTIPIGRIAAKRVNDIKIYLDKVVAHENPFSNDQTIEDQLWKKSIIHLSGGDASIQQTLFNYLSDMANIIETNQFGADVTTFRKTSSDPIQTSTSDIILNKINEGASIITFFGHSAVGTFDFSLEDPSEYDNFGKFPFIVSLGCYSGNIHSEGFGLSETFVLEEGKGAIAFLASSGTAYISPQYNSGKDYYGFIGDELYGSSIGKVLQKAIKKRDVTQALSVKTLNQQLTLHGDPAIKLHPKDGPDYVIDFKSVATTPSIVNTSLDSFKLNFDVVNLGRTVSDSIYVLLQHFTPDQEKVFEQRIKIKAPAYSSSIELFLPIEGVSYIGKNLIKLVIDSEDDILEYPQAAAESNNNLVDENGEEGFCFYILDNGAQPVNPYEFSILSKESVVLKASTTNGYLEEQKYIFEVDTTELFNSPLLQRGEEIQAGGIVEWTPSINFTHGEVYYWRVSPDSTNTELGYIWENSSFIYLPNSQSGWNQSHYYQFLKDQPVSAFIDDDREFKYFPKQTSIKIFNGIWDGTTIGYQVNNSTFAISIRPWNFMNGGIAVTILNPITGSHWTNSGGDFGSINTGNFGSFRAYGYDTKDPQSREALMNLIENEIPDGYYVSFFSVLRTEDAEMGIEDWALDSVALGQNIFSVIENNGGTMIRNLESTGTAPYTFLFVKGGEILGEGIGADRYDQIINSMIVNYRDIEGSFESSKIGPAKSWDKVLWNLDNVESHDSVSLNIFGINTNEEKVLLRSVNESENDLTDIDSDEYPYLVLSYYSKDDQARTIPEIDYWRVLYEEFPDAAIAAADYNLFHADTLEQGETLKVQVVVENTSCFTDMDSLLYKITIIDQNNIQEVFQEKIKPLLKNDTLHIAFEKNTIEMLGLYQFSIEINPNQDQAELFKFNNFGIKEFLVKKDNKNPLMDVTFDGAHILDGDIVSSQPFILVDLKDENKYLVLDDISLFDIALIYPDNNVWNIPLDHESLSFVPGTSDNNRAQLEFRPNLDQEGEYKLVVQAKDASENFSGNNAYEVIFRVILDQTVSNVLNYPNPFSSSTQFIFTLTGNEIPEVFSIQIMTLSGKVIKEITKAELGPLKIGINRTEYKWDGTDDYGEKLANGVYLYKVNVKDNLKEDLKHFDTNIDHLFKKGIGKLVILR
jgi:hypothetical protein